MTKIICLANQKGGVGKTTTTVNLAFHLVAAGKQVLVLDLDAQGNTSARLARTLDGEDMPLQGTKTAKLFDPELDKIEVMHCPRGMDLIHTPKNDPDLFEKEAVDLDHAKIPAANCQTLFEQYDYVLIDCPPSLGRKLVAALIMGTHVVCPVQVSGFAVDGIEGLFNTILGVREAYNPDLHLAGLFINNMDRESRKHQQSLAELEEAVGELLFKNRIMHRSPIDTAIDEGVPVASLGYGHVAAKEVKAVMEEIIKRVG